MLITDCRFRASHKHWVERIGDTSMIVSGMAIVFTNSIHVIIHTSYYRIILPSDNRPCRYNLKAETICSSSGVCAYTDSFARYIVATGLDWPITDDRSRSVYSLGCNRNYRVNMMVVNFTSITIDYKLNGLEL